MGVYKREAGLTLNGRPIWKLSNTISTTYFYYDSKGYWKMSNNYKQDSGWIQSKGSENPKTDWLTGVVFLEYYYKSVESGLTSIPKTGWAHYYGGIRPWMTVVGE